MYRIVFRSSVIGLIVLVCLSCAKTSHNYILNKQFYLSTENPELIGQGYVTLMLRELQTSLPAKSVINQNMTIGWVDTPISHSQTSVEALACQPPGLIGAKRTKIHSAMEEELVMRPAMQVKMNIIGDYDDMRISLGQGGRLLPIETVCLLQFQGKRKDGSNFHVEGLHKFFSLEREGELVLINENVIERIIAGQQAAEMNMIFMGYVKSEKGKIGVYSEVNIPL